MRTKRALSRAEIDRAFSELDWLWGKPKPINDNATPGQRGNVGDTEEQLLTRQLIREVPK